MAQEADVHPLQLGRQFDHPLHEAALKMGEERVQVPLGGEFCAP